MQPEVVIASQRGGDRLPTVEEIAAFRPQLLRLARGRRWAGDLDDMVQETLAWACVERDSYNPAKGTLGAWLWEMLISVWHEHVDQWRRDNPMVFERKARKSARKYEWPENLSQPMLEAIARPAELVAVRAMIAGQPSPYQGVRLAGLRKRMAEHAHLWQPILMHVEGRRPISVPLDAICVALRGTAWRLAPRRR